MIRVLENRRQNCHLRRQRRRGAATIEFAFLLPIFVITILGIFDWGLIMFTRQHMTQAAREAVRVRAAEQPNANPSLANTIAENYLAERHPTLADSFTVTVSDADDNHAWVRIEAPHADLCFTGGVTGSAVVQFEMEYVTAVPVP